MNRRLTAIERTFWINGKATSMNFALAVHVQGDLTLAQLEAALRAVRKRHPLLTVAIRPDQDGWPWYVSEGVPEIPVRVVEGTDPDVWRQETEDELARSIDWETGPLARFVWVRGNGRSVLIAVAHHVASDGLSVAYLIRDVMTQLGGAAADVEPLPALAGPEDLVPPAVSNNLLVRLVTACLAVLFKLQMRFKKSVFDADRPKDAYRLLPWVLTEAQTRVLVDRCREAQTTVHAAICTAFLLSYADLRGGPRVRRIQSPVSLRQHLVGPVEEAVGLLITIAETRADCAPGRDFWEIARDVKTGFTRGSAGSRLFLRILTMKRVLRNLAEADIINNWSDCEVEYDLSVSNLGRLEIPVRCGPYQIEVIHGPLVNGTRHEQVLGVTTIAGRMSMTFVYRSPTMHATVAEQIVDGAMQRLGEAVGW